MAIEPEPRRSARDSSLIVRGAREHNLKNITVAIPRDRLVVITGPSGSGKSSLVFDTIYAEAQRRYVESLSVYARQFLGQMPKPDVDGIDGLSPAISVRQQGTRRSPRSTVGTLTEIYDYLRLLFARAGVPHSPATGKEMRAFSVQQVVDRVLALPEDARLVIAAPLVKDAPGAFEQELARLRKDGFVRVLIDGALRDLGEDIELDPKRKHSIEVQVDRVRVKASARQRIGEAIELAYKLSQGFVHLTTEDGFAWLASERLVCVDTGESFPELTPRTFSFNSPEGACPTCGGLGVTREFVAERVVPDETLSLNEGAIAAWGRAEGAFYQRELATLAQTLKVNLDAPWAKLSKATKERILGGERAGQAKKGGGDYEGVLPGLRRRSREFARRRRGRAEDVSEVAQYLEEELSRYAREAPCPECEGARLTALARHVKVHGETLPTLCARPLASLGAYLADVAREGRGGIVTERILKDIRSRVDALLGLGLDYLSLDRSASTLSGGEIERIRLATQIGSGLVSVLYVLDEPSAGLHARDNERLIASLHRLRDQGNSLLVVEHDEATIRAADHVIDLGPGAGVNGGQLMAQGSPAEIAAQPDSPSGAYLSGRAFIPTPRERRASTHFLELDGVSTHNLREVSVRIPIAALTCVTGVSGSGKSSLVIDSLLPAVKQALRGESATGVELRGAARFDRVIEVDQSAIGRTPRSSPASFVGAFDEIRELFATLPEARARAYGPARFSFNVKGGRCEVCKGDGLVRVDMQFLPDVFVVCESCGGERYNRETLDVRYRGYSVADVLRMSIAEARELFAQVPKLATKLSALCDVGLGYLALGQPANTLSGGEAQRIKLARELARKVTGSTLLVLDEPTTGLHFQDVALLIDLLQRLVSAGNTVVVVEHQLDLIRAADYVIDMGPEGGPAGGQVVAVGTPEQVAREPRSHTGRYLGEALARAERR